MNELSAVQPTEGNIIPLNPGRQRTRLADVAKHRFKVVPFTNRAGSQAWRVTGTKRDGARVRENHSDQNAAHNRLIELEAEFQSRAQTDTTLRATRLTDTQIRLAEVAFLKLDSDQEILGAVDFWIKRGRHEAVTTSVKLDDAVKQFSEWLDTQAASMRLPTRQNLKKRVNLFGNSIQNFELAAITSDTVAAFLEKRNVSQRTRINDRLAISRFFSWCREKPRRWIALNPAAKEGKAQRQSGELPKILPIADCERLMRTAEKFKKGCLVPYTAACLFGGLRPSEAERLRLDQVNQMDGEITLEPNQTKTHRPRTIKMPDTLKTWLEAYKGHEFRPPNFIRNWAALRRIAGFGTPTDQQPQLKPWTTDIMRHSAISNYFRNCGSYGLTAEWAGNSESIIRQHYQGRVSSEETKRFYAILPKKGRTK